ncbi:hypothetical protein ACHWQZ_G003992 [Mnemiopsis leidyi]
MSHVVRLSRLLISPPRRLLAMLGGDCLTKPEVVFVLGPPGAGKGTQCQKIVEKYGYTHLSAGDLLRAERASGSPDGDLIESHIRGGTIVPVAITVKLLAKAMEKVPNGKFLIDGFPRNEDNVAGWDKDMQDKVNLKFVLFYECEEEECLRRALGRNQGRSDDNVESFRKRIQTYLNSTMPIVNNFKGMGLLRNIDASSDPESVFLLTQKCFEK